MSYTPREAATQLLQNMQFGSRTAEEESDELSRYFVQTDQWKRIFGGQIDVIYGPKGAGKSAIYTLLDKERERLFSGNIITATAENPRGATVFRNIVLSPPASEREFINLWKIYIICILGTKFREYDLSGVKAKRFISRLVELELLPPEGNLAKLFKTAWDFASTWFKRSPKSVTWSATIEPTFGLPIPTRTSEYDLTSENNYSRLMDNFNPDDALQEANDALLAESFKCWVLFDRLDVAFEDSRELEKNALRALFRVYGDMRGLDGISLKIFVRDDIWKRITEVGFAEASHITRTVTIRWDTESLLNLVVRRILSNTAVVLYYDIDPKIILSSIIKQKEFFYRIFPRQVDSGAKQPETFEWILGRTKDGTGVNTPRELIHFLTEIRDEQIRRIERGEEAIVGMGLFDRSVFKVALQNVSETRLTQTLIAEYPEYRPLIYMLKNERTLHSPMSLSRIWNVTPADAQIKASELTTIGFFEARGSKAEPQYWVPFIYRDALELVQGTAE